MEHFSLNSAKSFLGKNVNLHLKDGSVIINVQLTGLRKGEFGKGNFVDYVPYGNPNVMSLPLKSVDRARLLNMLMFQPNG